jgi:HlyD family secretion protein
MSVPRPLRARLGWLLLAVVIVAAAGGYEYYRQRQAAQAREATLDSLRSEVIRRGSIRAVVSATGAILPETQTNLAFMLPGTVAEVLVEIGDEVRAAQVLARLDSTELLLGVQQARDALLVAELARQKLEAGPSAEEVAAAEANLRAAQIAARDAGRGAGEEEVAIARLRYDNLQADYRTLADQYNQLVQFGIDHPRLAPSADVLEPLKARMEAAYYAAEIARLQLEQLQEVGRGPASVASAQVLQAQATLSQTLAAANVLQIEQADLRVIQARAALQRAELRLSHTEITAPHDGVVASVGVRPGEPAVGTAASAIVLLDATRFHLDVTVDEVDVARLSTGQAVTVRIDALPNSPVSGRVDRLSPLATGSGGLVNYVVRLALESTAAPLRAGMSATAEIVVAEVNDAVLVPNWAIRRDRRTGQAYASMMVENHLVELPIVTGLRGDAYTEVLEGVEPGETAAISTARDGLNLFGGG